MPCGARGELFAFKQSDVGDAVLGQVIGNRTADNSSTDDHDIGGGGPTDTGEARGLRQRVARAFDQVDAGPDRELAADQGELL